MLFLSPHRYDRRPSSSSRRYSELLATGIVLEPTEEEWRIKDLSDCILAADPECLPRRGKVILTQFLLPPKLAKGWGPASGLPVWAGELLQGGGEQGGVGEGQEECGGGLPCRRGYRAAGCHADSSRKKTSILLPRGSQSLLWQTKRFCLQDLK